MTIPLQLSIDGPTGSGKTTLGITLALRYGAVFLDTGLTFRGLAYLKSEDLLPPDDSWKSLLSYKPFDGIENMYRPREELIHAGSVFYKDLEVTGKLWGFDVDNQVDVVASDRTRRSEVLDYHRKILESNPRILIAGRDIASSLLPDADLHIYLTAEFSVRRERRRAQRLADPTISPIVGAMTRLDTDTLKDLQAKRTAAIIDTTYLPKTAVVRHIESLLKSKGIHP